MKKILVVDDEPFIVMIVEDKLKNAGYEVLTQRTGKGIVELVKSSKPDLLIMDWMLPGENGLDICRKLKKNPETSSTPIFMLTARGQEADEKLCLECGIEQYITKPFSPMSLVRLVENTIGRPE